VPQDEGLFHGEWEDVVHALECHRFGIPQRLNPHAILESVYSHHSLLAHLCLPALEPDGSVRRPRGFASTVFLAHRLFAAHRLRPIGRIAEVRLREQVSAACDGLPTALVEPARAALRQPIRSLGGWWTTLARTLRGARPEDRSQALAALEFLWRCCGSPVWHRNQVQTWLRGIETGDGTWERLLEQHRDYFRAWERLYPSFFERAGAEVDEGLQRLSESERHRQRTLRLHHWRSRGCAELLHSPSSLGELPRLENLGRDGAPVSRLVAVASRLLVPLEYALASRQAHRILDRLARLDLRRTAARLVGRRRLGSGE
jgi:hypothetical protein